MGGPFIQNLYDGITSEFCDGYPTSVVTGVVEGAEDMHHQPSQVVQPDTILFLAQTVPAVHLLMVESCWFIRAKVCRLSRGRAVQPCLIPVRFCVYKTGFLLKSGFPAVVYLLFGGFGLGTLMYIFFTHISSLMALLEFRMGNFGSILPLCFEFVFAGAFLS